MFKRPQSGYNPEHPSINIHDCPSTILAKSGCEPQPYTGDHHAHLLKVCNAQRVGSHTPPNCDFSVEKYLSKKNRSGNKISQKLF